MTKVFLSLLVFFVFLSCGNEIEQLDIDYGRDYYPIEVGNEWTYSYDSIVYNRQFGTTDTLTGFIKEVIESELEEVGGSINYRLERYRKTKESDPWRINAVWRIEVSDQQLIRTEENLSFIRLVFPVREGVDWDGNAAIDNNADIEINGDPIQMFINWDYTFKAVLDMYTVGNRTFSDVVHVEEVDTDDGLGKRLVNSYYARGVGLIHREMEILDCTNCDPAIPWDVKGDKGFKLSMNLIE